VRASRRLTGFLLRHHCERFPHPLDLRITFLMRRREEEDPVHNSDRTAGTLGGCCVILTE